MNIFTEVLRFFDIKKNNILKYNLVKSENIKIKITRTKTTS